MPQNHTMRLDAPYFDMVADGSKTIEIRLNDPKRQMIQNGDTITFKKRPEETDTLTVEVTALDRYPTWEGLVNDTPLSWGGPHWRSKEKIIAGGTGYSESEIQQYGFLRIGIRLL